MVKKFLVILMILLALLLLACSGEKKAETKVEAETETQTAVQSADQATCPGCNMTMDKDKMITHVAEGDTMYFCSDNCKNKYLAELEETEDDMETEQ